MKKELYFSRFIAISMLLFLSFAGFSQTQVTIGTGTGTNYRLPYTSYYAYAWSQQIYTSSEINTTGTITKIAFYVGSIQNGSSVTSNNQKIYLLETTASAHSSTTYQNPASMGATLVYNGSITYQAGWVEITLQTPFTHTAGNNLLIAYESRHGSSNSAYPLFQLSSAGSYSLCKYNNSNSVSILNTGSSGSSYAYRSNIRLTFQTSSNDLAMQEWTFPQNGATAGSSIPVMLKVNNSGTAAQSGFTVKYSIDNGASWKSQVYSSSLASGTNTTVYFTSTSNMANMSSTGVYRCIAVVRNTGDTITANDTLRKDITVCGGSYSGTYTIGTDTASDFPSIESAIASVKTCGISANTTFRIKDGTYNKQIRIGAITGLSSTKTLTFESYSTNPNDVIYQYSASGINDNYVLKMDTSNYVSFKNITFKANGNAYARAIEINASKDITIDGCNINGAPTTTNNAYNNVVVVQNNSTLISKNITFINNTIKNGNDAINLSAYNYSNHAYNFHIINNDITDFKSRGVYTHYVDTVDIKSNYIFSDISTSNLIDFTYGNGNSEISKNKLVGASSNIIYLYYALGTSSTPVNINNNFIHISNAVSSYSGIYVYSSNYVNIDYNSIHIKGTYNSTRGLYIASGSYMNIRNNNVINASGGYALYASSTSSILSTDYNNYYTTGSILARWGYTNCYSLATLKTSSGKESQSMNNNVSFYSDDNLHISGSSLNNMGIPISGINEDFDGQTRNSTTPDIGADEFQIYQNDAGLLSFENLSSICPGSAQNITVKLKNFGSGGIANVKIGWSVNGNSQGIYTWTGLLGLLNSTNTTIGTYNFSPDSTYEIKAWVNSVNLVTDSNQYNDTVTLSNYHTSLAGGTYQIGSSSSADFSDITSAINAVNQYGICGPIVFNIENGTYTGQYSISSIIGQSSTNTITFKSLSGDSADVVLANNSTSNTSAHIFQLETAKYINFKNLTFKSLGTNYSRLIYVFNNSHHIGIDACNFIGIASTNTYSNALIDINQSNQVTVKNSSFNQGSVGIYCQGYNTTNYITDIKLMNNSISNFYTNGILLNYVGDSIQVNGNTIRDKSTSYNSIGISMSYGLGKVDIYNNNIELSSNQINSGIYSYRHNYYSTSSSNTLNIYNNFVKINASTTYSVRGIYLYYGRYLNLYYNTVKIVSGNTNSYALYLYYSNYNNIKNNIFDVGTQNIYYVYGSSITSSDYNNFYSDNTSPMYYSYSNRTIAYYKSYSGLDSHSKNVDPNYVGANDLHLHDILLNNVGTPISGITTDIDGDTRNSTTPDIGADEFTMLANDAELYAINRPSNITAVGNTPIKVAIRNMGTSNLVLDSIHYQLDANSIVSVRWIGNLAPLAIDSFILVGTETISAGTHNLKVWSSNPNNTVDLNPTNDTISKTFTVQVMPTIVVEPSILVGTITTCNDSIVVPLKIKNTGGATLTYTESNTGAEPYDSTISNTFNTSGAISYHTYNGISPNADTVILIVTIRGDFDQSSERVYVYADNNLLGNFYGSSTTQLINHTYTLTGANLANWIADGQLIIKLQNSSSVSGSIGSPLHRTRVQSSGESWLSHYSSTTGSIAAGDSTIINYTFNGIGLENGIYTGSIQLLSNDYGNPTLIVPCTMTVAGSPIISSSTNSISFGGAYINIASYDSIEVYNTGCGDLVISNINTSNSAFSIYSNTDTIVPGDTGIVVYKFLSATAGAYAATSTIYSNTTNYTINLAANATNPPAITATPSPMNVTVTNCNDSILTNLQIQNTGGGTLTATVEEMKDSVEILILTYGSYYSYLNYMKSSLNFTYSKFNYTELYSTNATLVQNQINSQNVDVIIIPYLNGSSYASSYSSLATTLQNFVSGGGTVIFAGQYYSNIFSSTGLISGSRNGGTDYKNLTTQNTNDPITLNFASTYYSGTDDFNYYTFTGTGVTSLVKYGSYDVAVRKQYGAGNVIVIGYYYNSIQVSNTKAIISNSIKFVSEQGADWLQFSSSNANLSSGSSALKSIKFNANGMASGTYTAQIKITSNAPTNPIIYVPCTLTVLNQMANGVDLGSDTTSCGALTLNAGSFSSYAWNTGNTTQTISAVSTGTYSVTVSNGSSCTSSDTIAVTINPIPSVSLVGLPSSSCTNNAVISLNASPSGGVFAGPGVSSGTFDPSLVAAGTHTIFYSFTNAYNCTNSASQQITVYNPPTVSFSGLSTTYCPQGTASVLSGTPIGGSFSGSGIVQNSFVPSIAGVGSHNIVYAYTDLNNCSNTDTNSTFVNSSTISISISGYQSSYCVNHAIDTLIATPSGGVFSGNGVIGNMFNPYTAGVGTHYIKYTKQDANSCMVSDSVAITVHALPSGLYISGLNQSFCANDAASTLGGYPAGGVLSGLGVNGNNFIPAVAGSGIHIITYTYTDVYGCINSVSSQAQVDSVPLITFTNLQSQYCANDNSVSVVATPAGGTLSGDELNGNLFNPSYSGIGSYYIYYEFTNVNLCYNKDSFNVVVNGLPTVSIGSLAASFCSNSSSVSLSGTPMGGTFSGSGVSGSSFNPSNSGIGAFYVNYTYTDNNGCSNIDSVSTTVNQVHGVNAGNDATISYNTSTQLTGLVTGGGTSFNFSWTPANLVSNASQLSPSTTNLTNSTIFTLSVTDNGNSCVNSDQVQISITGGPLTASSSASPATICQGENSQLSVLGSGGASTSYTYAWTSNPSGFSSTISNPIVSPTVTTVYTCIIGDGTDTVHQHINLTVNPTPMVQITNLNNSYCNNESIVSLIVSPPGGNLSGGGISGLTFNPTTASLGQNTVIYSMTNSNNCYGADTVLVSVFNAPSAYAGKDTLLPCVNGGISLGQQPVTGVSYLWNPPIALSNHLIANPTAMPNLSVNYALTATDNTNGCTAYDTVFITVIGAPTAHASNDTLVCPNSPVNLTASGGDTYFWSNGGTGSSITVSPSVSTLYYVIVSQAGCADLDTVYVNVSDPKPSIGLDTTLCGNQNITLDAGAGFTSYNWSTNANTQTILVDSNGIGFSNAEFSVEVIDTLSCIGNDTIMIAFTNCTGLNNIDDKLFLISIYPNPSKGKFVISSNETAIKSVDMQIMDARGRQIIQKQIASNNGTFKEFIDLSTQPKGVYFIKLSNAGIDKVFKVLIQ